MIEELLKYITQPFADLCQSGDPASLPEDLRSSVFKTGFSGGYFFEGSLLIRPIFQTEVIADIFQWNSINLWKMHFEGVEWKPSSICFAEDVFGYQFIWNENLIYRFDPETGEKEMIADGIEEWLHLILSDTNYWTGRPILNEWNRSNPRLDPGFKLVAREPFVCGGSFSIKNLASVSEVDSMKIRAPLAAAIRNTPDGEKIRFTIVD